MKNKVLKRTETRKPKYNLSVECYALCVIIKFWCRFPKYIKKKLSLYYFSYRLNSHFINNCTEWYGNWFSNYHSQIWLVYIQHWHRGFFQRGKNFEANLLKSSQHVAFYTFYVKYVLSWHWDHFKSFFLILTYIKMVALGSVRKWLIFWVYLWCGHKIRVSSISPTLELIDQGECS